MDESRLRQFFNDEASKAGEPDVLPVEVRRRALRRRRHHLGVITTAAAVVVAGVSTATTLALVGNSGSKTRLEVAPQPSQTTANDAVPWVDRPPQPYKPVRPAPSSPAPVPPGTPNCQSTALHVTDVTNPGYTQSDGVSITVRNTGNRSCALHGYPTRVTGIRDDGRRVRLSTSHEPADLGRPNDKTIPWAFLRPQRDVAYISVDSQRACLSDYRGLHTYRAVQVGLPGGTTLDVNISPAGYYSYFACGGVGVQPFLPPALPEPSSAGTFEALSAHVEAPTTAMPGQLLRYVVTITNSSGKNVSFRSCPSYQEAFYTSGGAQFVGRYQLNCDTVHVIPAGQSVRYAMQLPVPANASGTVKFTWFLLDDVGPSGSARIQLGTQTPTP